MAAPRADRADRAAVAVGADRAADGPLAAEADDVDSVAPRRPRAAKRVSPPCGAGSSGRGRSWPPRRGARARRRCRRCASTASRRDREGDRAASRGAQSPSGRAAERTRPGAWRARSPRRRCRSAGSGAPAWSTSFGRVLEAGAEHEPDRRRSRAVLRQRLERGQQRPRAKARPRHLGECA